MPKSSKAKLAYQAAYNARPEETDKRVEYNRNRREAMKEGKVHVGDGKQIDHKKPLDKGGTNADSNLRVTSEGFNKGWRGRQPEMYGKGKK